jgi:hypothetical protein
MRHWLSHLGMPCDAGDVRYYQGLHDIAAVLLLVLGSEEAAFPVLCRLVACGLRDCTRDTIEPVRGNDALALEHSWLWAKPLMHTVYRFCFPDC